MWLTKQLSSIATVATMALGVLLVSPLTPARASAKRMNWIPSGDYNPSVGDLWSFTCPKGGTFSLFVDTLKDNPDGTSSIDPYFEVVDGKGDLVQFRDTDFECSAPPRCGVDGWCPGAWDVPCGRGATHTIAIGSTPGGGLACSGGGGYEIRLEVRTKTGKLLKDTQTKLGGGAVRKLPKWAAGVGKNGPILEDQVVPTLTFPFDACSPTLSVERELFFLAARF